MPLDAWINNNNKPLSQYRTQEMWQQFLLSEQIKADAAAMAQQKVMNTQTVYYTQPSIEPCQCEQCMFGKLRCDPGLPEGERKQRVLRLLQEGRARLEQPGVWTQGHDRLRDPDVPGGWTFCARGVLVWLAVRMSFDQETLKQAFVALAREAPHKIDAEPQSIIANWNDDKRTRLHDVLSCFGRAITCLERELQPAMA